MNPLLKYFDLDQTIERLKQQIQTFESEKFSASEAKLSEAEVNSLLAFLLTIKLDEQIDGLDLESCLKNFRR